MNREQVKKELLKGKTLKELFDFQSGQGCDIYKGDFSLSDDILYIPDIDLNEIPVDDVIVKEEVERVADAMYSGLDFLAQCDGNEELAKELFCYCDWQHPPAPGMRTFYMIWKNEIIKYIM